MDRPLHFHCYLVPVTVTWISKDIHSVAEYSYNNTFLRYVCSIDIFPGVVEPSTANWI